MKPFLYSINTSTNLKNWELQAQTVKVLSELVVTLNRPIISVIQSLQTEKTTVHTLNILALFSS